MALDIKQAESVATAGGSARNRAGAISRRIRMVIQIPYQDEYILPHIHHLPGTREYSSGWFPLARLLALQMLPDLWFANAPDGSQRINANRAARIVCQVVEEAE